MNGVMGNARTIAALKGLQHLKRWSHVCLRSLVAFLIGACLVLPATSFALQNMETVMPDTRTDSKLPKGVFPPMPGYTNEELATAACQEVDVVLKESNIDPTLARETLFDLFNHLNKAFTTRNVDYQVSTWYQKPYDDPSARAESVNAMAKEFNAYAVRAAGESLINSPLKHMDDAFIRRYLSSAGAGVQGLIETLNLSSN
ncbi:hypothetical protein IAE38_002356 [Pseudomonas sp. S32]|nr:hypothetical protein [Pseudomonas sp. S32]